MSDQNEPIDYSRTEAPSNYACSKCGATGCKLWREYQSFRQPIELLCATCAAEDQKQDISDIDSRGMYTKDPVKYGVDRRSDSIGWFVPAVPTEENDGYWGLTSVTEKGWSWWETLPTLPNAATTN